MEKSLNEEKSRCLRRIVPLTRLEQQIPSLAYYRARRSTSVAAAGDSFYAACEDGGFVQGWSFDGTEAGLLESEARVLAGSGDSLVAAGHHGTLEFWGRGPGEPPRRACADAAVSSLALAGPWLFAGLNGRALVYSLPSLWHTAVLGGMEGKIAALAADTFHRRLYALADYRSDPVYSAVYVWELPAARGRFRMLRRLYGFGGRATCMAADPGGRWIAAGEACGNEDEQEPSRILVWDARTLRIRHVLPHHLGWVGAVALSPDGRYLVSGDHGSKSLPREESNLYLYDLDAGRLHLRLTAHRGGIRSLAFDPEGRFLVSGGCDGVWLWSVNRLLTAGAAHS